MANARTRSRAIVYLATLASLTAMFAASCRDPTEVTLVLTTTGVCNTDITTTSIFVASNPVAVNTEVTANSPVAKTSNCVGTNIGTLVLTPGASSGAVVVVAGGAQCAAQGQGCIIARRSFSFVSHTSLTIPISLDPDCANVPCDEYSTCENGTCRSASVSCADNGTCTDPSKNPVVVPEAGASDGSATNDSGTDDGSSGEGDSSIGDGSTSDGGLSDGGLTQNGPECHLVGGSYILSCGGGECDGKYECCASSPDPVCQPSNLGSACSVRYCCSDSDCVGFPHQPHPGVPMDGGGDSGSDSGSDSGAQTQVPVCTGFTPINPAPGTCQGG